MPTGATIKASIDTNITNKTLPGTIDNTLVGADVKSVVDYVDQEVTALSATLGAVATSNDYNDLDNLPTITTGVVKTTLSLAQVQALNTTPITILTQTSGKSRFPLSIYIVRTDTTAYTLANDYFDITNNAGGFYGYSIPCAILGFAGASYVYSALPLSTNGSGLTEATFKLKANVGNPTGGAGGLDVYVTYTEITL